MRGNSRAGFGRKSNSSNPRGKRYTGKDKTDSGSSSFRPRDNKEGGDKLFSDSSQEKRYSDKKETSSSRPYKSRDGKESGDKKYSTRTKVKRYPSKDKSESASAFKPRETEGGERKSYSDRPKGKGYFDKDKTGSTSSRSSFKPKDTEAGERRSYSDRPKGKGYFDKDKTGSTSSRAFKPREEDGGERKSYSDRPKGKGYFDKDKTGSTSSRSSFKPRDTDGGSKKKTYAENAKGRYNGRTKTEQGSFKTRDSKENVEEVYSADGGWKGYKPETEEKKEFNSKSKNNSAKQSGEGLVRLNKYISNAGIASRREADVLIQTGVISVNGKVITELGYKIKPTDLVNYDGQMIKQERPVYILLNKPKNYITTSDDPFERDTVLSLIRDACKERVYPVGRLDRNTTGLLLMTNDGDLTKKLTHPKYGKKKLYHVSLDKPLTKPDFIKIESGLELEDGEVQVDELSYVSGQSKSEVGIELHSGRNRIVRRIFESLGYEVKKLDRVSFAGLTKKDLPRGRWRFLTTQEISFLKM